eukprot:gene15422-16995_t
MNVYHVLKGTTSPKTIMNCKNALLAHFTEVTLHQWTVRNVLLDNTYHQTEHLGKAPQIVWESTSPKTESIPLLCFLIIQILGTATWHGSFQEISEKENIYEESGVVGLQKSSLLNTSS